MPAAGPGQGAAVGSRAGGSADPRTRPAGFTGSLHSGVAAARGQGACVKTRSIKGARGTEEASRVARQKCEAPASKEEEEGPPEAQQGGYCCRRGQDPGGGRRPGLARRVEASEKPRGERRVCRVTEDDDGRQDRRRPQEGRGREARHGRKRFGRAVEADGARRGRGARLPELGLRSCHLFTPKKVRPGRVDPRGGSEARRRLPESEPAFT